MAEPGTLVRVAAADDNFDIDMIVTFSGKCATFRAAGQSLPCRAMKYFHGQGGRAYFTIAIDDPTDKGHILSFSGEKARREKNDLYELTIDQMLLNSKDRPQINAVRVPLVKPANGICRQFGDIEKKLITAVSCRATDKDGLKYELEFEADQLGRPVLASERFHARLHNRAGLHGPPQARIRQAQLKIIGLSVDPVTNHGKWAADIEETQGHAVTYPMIGDPELKTAKLYDMLPADAGTRPRAAPPPTTPPCVPYLSSDPTRRSS